MKKQSLHTEQSRKGHRRFYFDIKDTRHGKNYMTISSIKMKENEAPERSQIIIFESEMDGFAGAFMRSLLNFESRNSR